MSTYTKYISALSSQSIGSSLTTCPPTNMNNEKKVVGGKCTNVKDEIERSKVHWSQLVAHLDSTDDGVVKGNNVDFFKSLQKHPTWGYFFKTIGDGGIFDVGKLELGKKFAEGGQAKLYHANVTWKDPNLSSSIQKNSARYVLKVFKKEIFLQDLQKQWPQGMFKAHEESLDRSRCRKSLKWRFDSGIVCGMLLQDGRFAFLMVRAIEDLRTLIDCKMKERSSLDCGPFPMEMAYKIMYSVARGMDWLHNLNIVHRDLKASNVLYNKLKLDNDSVFFHYLVADYECSIGVIGTGFFRAPEVLQAIKNKVVNKRPNVFTKAGDVYGYGMVCYEILAGNLPFEGHLVRDYDLVLQGQRPKVPHYVDEWVCDLLNRCWQHDALNRPTFREILEVLEANSKDCIELKRLIEGFEALSFGEQCNLYEYEF